jgi:hypothetical protein
MLAGSLYSMQNGMVCIVVASVEHFTIGDHSALQETSQECTKLRDAYQ